MKPILHTLNSGGSGTGYSYYAAWAKCGRAATLAEKAKVDGEQQEEPSYFGIGRIYHALLELHFKRGMQEPFDVQAVQYSDTVDEEIRVEAERLFRAFRVICPPNTFGTVKEIEIGYPQTIKQTDLLAELAGMPYSFKPDMVVRLDKVAAQGLQSRWQLDVSPGYYLVDHKTLGQWDGSAISRYMNSHQFTLYQMAWNALFPKMPVQGLIADIMLKYKAPELKMLLIPFPDETAQKAALAFLKYCKFIQDNAPDFPNSLPENCFPKGRTCNWFTQGLCNRH